MNRLLLLIVIILSFSVEEINAQEDHLEPVNSIFDIYDYQFEYYSKIRKVLFDGLSDTPEISFLVMASFIPETVLRIEKDRENDKFYIIYHRCNEMIWYNDNWSKVKVTKFRKEISADNVELVKNLFKKAISKVRYPEGELFGTDGTNYYFSVNDFGQKVGTIWSPKEGSNMRKLVEIGMNLIEFTKTRKNKNQINEKLSLDIKKLTERI